MKFRLNSKHFMVMLIVVTIFLALLTIITGCGGSEDDSSNDQTGSDDTTTSDDTSTDSENSNASSVVEVTEDITAATVWSGGTVYVVSSHVNVENTLTIEPSAVIKFQSGEDMEVNGEGVIIANGTQNAPIIFTSYRDDDHGGDTNGDGNATTAAASDWEDLEVYQTNGSVFNYCRFFYGGSENSYCSVLRLNSSRTTVTNCVFAHNMGCYDGNDYTGALDAQNAEVGTVITGNRFFDNVVPLSINHNYNIDDSNSFSSPDGSIGNTYNAIFCESARIDRNLVWAETEVAFVPSYSFGYVIVESDVTLTLGDNVVLKFPSGSSMSLDDGETALINHGGSGVAFTSFRDDSLKGDSNGDGTSTAAADYDWEGIEDGSRTISDPDYFFTWSNIYYDSY